MSKIRMGLVGGGPGAFIGVIHRLAAWLDGEIELVCGAFSRDAEKSRQTGRQLYLPADRVYGSYTEMIESEARRPENERMEFVAIVTPNNSHYPIASLALEKGFHVMCDKPATLTLQETLKLHKQVEASGLLFGLTHTYTGYTIVKEARERVKRGDIGTVTKVVAEYTQGWLASVMGADEGKQAAWRLDPKYAGISCCMGDIGVHAANLAEFISGQSIIKILSDLGTVEAGRQLDDDGAVFLRFANGARGLLFSSQISIGEENNLCVRVYGTKGSLEWQQMEPNSLWMKWPDRPAELVRAGHPYLTAAAQANSRTPAGHPEGYIEAFANIYKNFAAAIADSRTQKPRNDGIKVIDGVPGIAEAIAGMTFIETVVSSTAAGNVWMDIKPS